MRLLGLLFALIGIALVVFVVRAYLEAGRTNKEYKGVREQVQIINSDAFVDLEDLGPQGTDHPEEEKPLCDRLFGEKEAPLLSLPPSVILRDGKRNGAAWTYLNLWAAWCKPCKEEMPLLAQFMASHKDVRLIFASVDDDERQLRRATEGLSFNATYLWIRDEGARSRFYHDLGLKDPPTLPVQVVIDKASRLRCVRVGTVTEADLNLLSRTFGWQ